MEKRTLKEWEKGIAVLFDRFPDFKGVIRNLVYYSNAPWTQNVSNHLGTLHERLQYIDWGKLEHAYGSAADIPEKLQSVAEFLDEGGDGQTKPWHSLWSALCHQVDAYTASIVATPLLVSHLTTAPLLSIAGSNCDCRPQKSDSIIQRYHRSLQQGDCRISENYRFTAKYHFESLCCNCS